MFDLLFRFDLLLRFAFINQAVGVTSALTIEDPMLAFTFALGSLLMCLSLKLIIDVGELKGKSVLLFVKVVCLVELLFLVAAILSELWAQAFYNAITLAVMIIIAKKLYDDNDL